MPLVLIRVDDRLIHGQVVEGWLRSTHATHIWVINDNAANDELQQALLSLATPSHIKLSILDIQTAVTKFKTKDYEHDRVLVVFSNLTDLLRIAENGIELESVNIGGLHLVQGKVQVLKHLCLDDNDIDIIKKLAGHGISLECRALPPDGKENVIDVIHNKYKK